MAWKATYHLHKEHHEWYFRWVISKEKGWYCISVHEVPMSYVGVKFRKLLDAKKFCEVFDTLIDWEKIVSLLRQNKHIEADNTLLAQVKDEATLAEAAKLTSLDYSRLSSASDLRDLAAGRMRGG